MFTTIFVVFNRLWNTSNVLCCWDFLRTCRFFIIDYICEESSKSFVSIYVTKVCMHLRINWHNDGFCHFIVFFRNKFFLYCIIFFPVVLFHCAFFSVIIDILLSYVHISLNEAIIKYSIYISFRISHLLYMNIPQ